VKKRSKLVLPTPQISDTELEEVQITNGVFSTNSSNTHNVTELNIDLQLFSLTLSKYYCCTCCAMLDDDVCRV